jgi:DNA-binding NarL/FixJ family response regulator
MQQINQIMPVKNETKAKSKRMILTSFGINGKVKAHVTPREKEILQLISDGHNNKDVAEKLGLSEKTVANHTQNMRVRFGVTKIIPLIKIALKKGLIT